MQDNLKIVIQTAKRGRITQLDAVLITERISTRKQKELPPWKRTPKLYIIYTTINVHIGICNSYIF